MDQKELQRRLETIDARLEGINTHTKGIHFMILVIMLGVMGILFSLSGWF
jgi:hypothetical protein